MNGGLLLGWLKESWATERPTPLWVRTHWSWVPAVLLPNLQAIPPVFPGIITFMQVGLLCWFVGRASLVTFYTSQAFLVVSWILRASLYEGRLQIWGNKTEHGKTKKLPSDQLPASPWLCFSPCAVASYVTACTRLILGSGSKASDELRESVFSGVSTILPSPTAWKMPQGQPCLH